MLLNTLGYLLGEVPKSLVHSVIDDVAHRGDVVRSNYWDRSNPIDNLCHVHPQDLGQTKLWLSLPIRLIPIMSSLTL